MRKTAVLVLFCGQAFAQGGVQDQLDSATRELTSCGLAASKSRQASAAEIFSGYCSRQAEAWQDACHARFALADDADARCRTRIHAIEQQVVPSSAPAEQKQPPRSRNAALVSGAPVPPSSSPALGSTDQAIRDLRAGAPLPGLPKTTLPIYAKNGTVVCRSLGMLHNPNTDILIRTGGCTVIREPRSVQVFSPADQQAYVEAHVYRSVRIAFLGRPMSEGSASSGWVRISSLSN